MNSMYRVIQFPDLTEIYSVDCSLINTVPPQTQFTFATKIWYKEFSTENTALIKAGFKEISTMNNWWPSHNPDIRPITLWWYRNPTKQINPIIAAPKHWGCRETFYGNVGLNCTLHSLNTQATGCGFKIGTTPLNRNKYFRYHTLLRLKLKPSSREMMWLTTHNFKFIDSSEFSSYWVNGFDSRTYDWKTVEEPYWKSKNIHLDARFLLDDIEHKKLYNEVKTQSRW